MDISTALLAIIGIVVFAVGMWFVVNGVFPNKNKDDDNRKNR